MEIDGNGVLLHEGSFVFLLPNVLLHGLSHTEDFRFGYVFFDFDYLSDFPLLLKPDISDRAINAPCRNLDAETFHLMDNYFDFIGKRHRKGENCQAVTKGLLFALVMEVSRFYAEGSTVVEVSRQDELADRFFRLLHVYYKVGAQRGILCRPALCVGQAPDAYCQTENRTHIPFLAFRFPDTRSQIAAQDHR